MSCPDDEQLVAFVESSLPRDAVVALEHHVDGCASCRQVIATLAAGSGARTWSGAVGAAAGARWPAGSAPRGDAADASTEAAAIAPGTLVAERYEIASRLGAGGMATVYLARDRTLGRTLALKLHRDGLEHARLDQEAVAMARLAHPNVVTVFEIGEHAGQRFVAMEYVAGGTLRAWLAAERRTWRAIVRMFLEIGEGLAAVHAGGLVHRDFKPENVLVGRDGRPRVSDFGLVQADAVAAARRSDPSFALLAPGGSGTNGRLTLAGTVVGTPAYMAPEQLDGALVDGRCDQFSFCVTMWEALFGARPFAGATLAAIHAAIAEQRIAAVPAGLPVPAALRRVLVRGLAASPADRFADMRALLGELRAASRPRTARRIAVAAAALAVIGGGTAWGASHVARARAAAACDARGAELAAIAGPFERARLAAAFAATGRPYAPASAERTSAALARSAAALATTAVDACRANEPTDVAALRATCLERHAADLGALEQALERADADSIEGAPAAAWSLVEPSPCADARALAAAPADARLPPADDAALAEARALLATGQYDAGLARARPVLDAARARGDRAAELPALIVVGELAAHAGSADAAVPLLTDAIALAEARGRDADGALVLAQRAAILGDGDHSFPAAHEDLELARAKLARIGGNPALEASLDQTDGQVATSEFQLDRAEAQLRAALEHARRAYGDDHPQVGVVLGTLSQVEAGRGAFPAAADAARRGLAISRAALGDDHPVVAGLMMTLAQAEQQLGQIDEARHLLRDADAIFARTLGDDHPARAQLYANLGALEAHAQRGAAAREAYGRALGIVERTGGGDGAFAGSLHGDLAGAALLVGKPEEALAEAARGHAILDHALAPDDPELAGALEQEARAQLALDRPALAVPLAERALALTVSRPGYSHEVAAQTELLVADALWAGGHRPAARARAQHAADVAAGTDGAAAVAAWLAAHPA